MNNLIKEGIEKGIIQIDAEQKNITYTFQNKKRSFQNPEEKIQAETFCSLVLKYGYPEAHIQQFVSVKMGVSDKEADIVVYKDKDFSQPYIIVECKKEDISEMEFEEAIKQAFSYAHALAGTTKYVWITKGNREDFYVFDKEKDSKEPLADIPKFGQNQSLPFKFVKGGFYQDQKINDKERHLKLL